MLKQDDFSTESGGLIPGTRDAAFLICAREDMPIPVLIAVPHAGRKYPEAIISRMREVDYSAIRLEDRFADKIAIAVAAQTGSALLVSHAPRAMLDLNRSPDDVDWDMIADAPHSSVRHSAANRRARNGLGLIPRRLPGLGDIWNQRMSDAELNARIRQIHTPYHAALGAMLNSIRDRWGAALLIDLHSMPPLKKSHRSEVPARFVLGDRFGASASDRLIASALRHFAEFGEGVAHNRPYAGGYVLDRHAAPVRGIHAIQLEICRSCYLDPTMRELTSQADGLAELIAGLVRTLAEEVLHLASGAGVSLAAE